MPDLGWHPPQGTDDVGMSFAGCPRQSCEAVVVCQILAGTCCQQQADNFDMSLTACPHQSSAAVVVCQIQAGASRQKQANDLDMSFIGCPRQRCAGRCSLPHPCWHLLPAAGGRFRPVLRQMPSTESCRSRCLSDLLACWRRPSAASQRISTSPAINAKCKAVRPLLSTASMSAPASRSKLRISR